MLSGGLVGPVLDMNARASTLVSNGTAYAVDARVAAVVRAQEFFDQIFGF
jgi:hypothetical protein